jgi:dUTP pyrophosphatase
MEQQLKVKRLHPQAVLPSYAKPGDAGLDLTAVYVKVDGDKLVYSTGIAIELPPGHVGMIFQRSSIYKYDLDLTNAVGIIDGGYTGEIKLVFRKTKDVGDFYMVGERIGQLVVVPIPFVKVEEYDELSPSERGEGGFGHTGK